MQLPEIICKLPGFIGRGSRGFLKAENFCGFYAADCYKPRLSCLRAF